MESFSTFQFLKEFEAHYMKNHNFCGLERYVICERFIQQAKPEKKLHIVDPSPYVVEAIINDTRIVPSNVAFVFGNKCLCTIYSRTDSMRGYSIIHVKEYPKFKDDFKNSYSYDRDMDSFMSLSFLS